MKSIPSIVIALLLAGAVAACLSSQRVYGQAFVPGTNPSEAWREHSQGMSSNAALAFYRLRSTSTVPTPLHPRFQVGSGGTARIQGQSASINQSTSINSYAPFSGMQNAVYRPSNGKPFENVRPAPTAFERYWPLMLEARQDPKSGLIIWSLP